MPNHRRPNRPFEVSIAENARQAFRGSLSGYSSVPQTRGLRRLGGGSASTGVPVKFFQDQFTVVTPGPQTLQLTYVPAENSEHLLVHSPGSVDGLYYRASTWSRAPESNIVVTNECLPVSVGDVIVMEYAYYGGAPKTNCEVSTTIYPSRVDLDLGSEIPFEWVGGRDWCALSDGSDDSYVVLKYLSDGSYSGMVVTFRATDLPPGAITKTELSIRARTVPDAIGTGLSYDCAANIFDQYTYRPFYATNTDVPEWWDYGIPVTTSWDTYTQYGDVSMSGSGSYVDGMWWEIPTVVRVENGEVQVSIGTGQYEGQPQVDSIVHVAEVSMTITVDTCIPQPFDWHDASIAAFDAWGLHHVKVSDGVILLVWNDWTGSDPSALYNGYAAVVNVTSLGEIVVGQKTLIYEGRAGYVDEMLIPVHIGSGVVVVPMDTADAHPALAYALKVSGLTVSVISSISNSTASNSWAVAVSDGQNRAFISHRDIGVKWITTNGSTITVAETTAWSSTFETASMQTVGRGATWVDGLMVTGYGGVWSVNWSGRLITLVRTLTLPNDWTTWENGDVIPGASSGTVDVLYPLTTDKMCLLAGLPIDGSAGGTAYNMIGDFAQANNWVYYDYDYLARDLNGNWWFSYVQESNYPFVAYRSPSETAFRTTWLPITKYYTDDLTIFPTGLAFVDTGMGGFLSVWINGVGSNGTAIKMSTHNWEQRDQ